jgi:hypothetical protein
MTFHRCFVVAISIALIGSFGCKNKPKSDDGEVTEPVVERDPPPNTTVNDFYAKGIPTFIMGTLGDERADRIISAQVSIVRNLVAPSARMLDTVIKLDDIKTWPPRAVVYGGTSFNQVIANLKNLPLSITEDKLSIGGMDFTGPGYQLITVIPEQEGHPEFVLYAGTGSPGVAEINAIHHGKDAILIADAFGVLHTGEWSYDKAGKLEAKLSEPARRVKWREVKAEGANIYFVEELPASADEAAIVANCEKGVAHAREKLGRKEAATISIYVSPDAKSKLSLTGVAGDGHAVVNANAVHVVGSKEESLVHLVAHEATHLLAYEAFEQPGSSLLGEGLAVWVSGYYGGIPIDDFAKELGKPGVINELLGPKFPSLPEKEAYMHGGLAVKAAIESVGFDEFTKQLWPATRDNWIKATEFAGTNIKQMQVDYEVQFPGVKKGP